MLEAFNTNTWMVAVYLVAAALACLTGLREQSAQRALRTTDLLPVFWFLTSALFGSMAIAHAGGLGGAVAEYARSGAYADGWYESRRPIQVVVVGAVALIWAVVTLLALWRIPERRRRYLPMTIATTTLMCFPVIRLVSLHHVDTLLYRRSIEGLGIGVIIEFGLLAIVALAAGSARRRTPQVTPFQHDVANSRPI
jgi:hypothetical protein